MRILSGSDEKDALLWLEKATEVARQSLCLRRKCGSIIVKDGEVLAEGFNSPPQNKLEYRTCSTEYDIPAGFRHDRTCCVHAEERAIQNALKAGKDTKDACIYFMAVDDNDDKTFATDMKCTICSRAVLDAGMKEFIFYSPEGIRSYDPLEVNKLSYEYKTKQIT